MRSSFSSVHFKYYSQDRLLLYSMHIIPTREGSHDLKESSFQTNFEDDYRLYLDEFLLSSSITHSLVP